MKWVYGAEPLTAISRHFPTMTSIQGTLIYKVHWYTEEKLDPDGPWDEVYDEVSPANTMVTHVLQEWSSFLYQVR